MTDPLLKFKIGLGLLPNIGPILTKRIIAYCGSIEAVFKEKPGSLSRIPGIGKKLAADIRNTSILDKAEKEIEYIHKHNIKTFFYLDKDFPFRLKNCEDGPVIIFLKGEIDLNRNKILSFVGTRNATPYGREQCEEIISELALRNHNPIIVSGLAFGIDICAHKAAISNRLKTAAVLGHGLSYIYPGLHRGAAEDIFENGALVTEFVSDISPEPFYFAKRNRLIAGLADATIVIESAEKGGALITADIANSYNRDVFAMPGKVTDKYSKGCNNLIKKNLASLITCAKDLEYHLGWEGIDTRKPETQSQLFVDLIPDEETILEILSKNREISLDQISIESNLPVSKVSGLLLNLEFNGLIRSMPGKVYKSLV